MGDANSSPTTSAREFTTSCAPTFVCTKCRPSTAPRTLSAGSACHGRCSRVFTMMQRTNCFSSSISTQRHNCRHTPIKTSSAHCGCSPTARQQTVLKRTSASRAPPFDRPWGTSRASLCSASSRPICASRRLTNCGHPGAQREARPACMHRVPRLLSLAVGNIPQMARGSEPTAPRDPQ